MELRAEARGLLIWVAACTLLLDFQWPWSAPWNWRPRSMLEDVACANPAGLAAQSDVDSGVKVILPSVGQTGTSSVVAALLELGMRTYHVEEQLVFTRPALTEEAESNVTVWARHMSRCRVEAVALEPVIDLWPTAWAASPNAKVILTWRDFNSWRVSTAAGGWKDLRWHFLLAGTLASGARVAPWLSLVDALTGAVNEILQEGKPFHGVGQATFLDMFGFYSFFRSIYADGRTMLPYRGTNKVAKTEEAYLAHIDDIIRLVPPERLLIFNVKKHGWRELTRFLGQPDKPESRKFPHPRSKDSWTNDAVWDHAAPEKRALIVLVFAALHVVNYVLFRLACWFLAPKLPELRARLPSPPVWWKPTSKRA